MVLDVYKRQHDPRVVNAIPLNGFENVMPSYQFIKGILKNVKDITSDADHLMIISPDEGCLLYTSRPLPGLRSLCRHRPSRERPCSCNEGLNVLWSVSYTHLVLREQ